MKKYRGNIYQKKITHKNNVMSMIDALESKSTTFYFLKKKPINIIFAY